LVFGIALVASIALRYGLADIFGVRSPVVSVKAEPVFNIDGAGFHFGPAMFEGGHHPGGFVVTNAMLMALLTTLVLFILSLLATRNMRIVPTGFQNFMELTVDALYNTFGSVDRKYIARFWPLVGGIFFYVLMANWLSLVPGVLSVGYRVPEAALHAEPQAEAGQNAEQHSDSATPEGDSAEAEADELVLVPYLRAPSADLNNTLMLGLIAFLFVEFWGFKELGLGYLGKFFPFREGPVMIFAGLLEFISEFVRIISFAFRLFGNIFAGEVILLVMLFLFPLLPLPFLGLELFVGFIQAFVFAILVMAFASLATQAHGGHDDHGHDQPEHAELGGVTRQNPAH
jgi:F-type H+-transporting ATPase subunit a